MPALTIADLNNAKQDVDHIAEVANSKAATATDRVGNIKPTVHGAVKSLAVLNFRGDFVSGVAYSLKDVYVSGGVAYVAAIDHVSTSVGADLASGKVVIHQLRMDGDGRFRGPGIIIGDEALAGPALRDAFVAGRTVEGSTDCHGFADRTVIDNVTDAGTYGAFDATTELYGSHEQNHVYAFQDRVRYGGNGTLKYSAGFYSAAVHSGTGTVESRYGMMIDEMAKTGGGTIVEQIGILINPLTTGANNVGLKIAQTSGWGVYAGGGAKSYHGGQFGIGTEPVAGAKLHVHANSFGSLPVAIRVEQPNAWSLYCTGAGKMYHQAAAGFGVEPSVGAIDFAGAGGATGFLTTDAGSILFGGTGDRTLKFVSGGDARLVIDATTYHVRPQGDNTQSSGVPSNRWSVVYAGTGSISTSDSREKQDVEQISDAELRVATAVRKLLRKFRFKDAIAAKGDAARIHFGAIAQEVIVAFEAEGLDAMRYGVVCYDEWDEEWVTHPALYRDSEIVDADGKAVRVLVQDAWQEKVREAGNRYGIRYDELLVFIIAAM